MGVRWRRISPRPQRAWGCCRWDAVVVAVLGAVAVELLRQFGNSTPIALYVMLGGLLSALGIFISLKRVHSHFPRLTNPDQDHATLR